MPTFYILECVPRDFVYSGQWLRAYRVECFFKRKATYSAQNLRLFRLLLFVPLTVNTPRA